jgi:hypothetical protein
MEGLSILTAIFGFLIRLALPIALTLLAAYLLRRLDQRWQQQGSVAQPGPVAVLKCWVMNDCPPEQRERCAAYQQHNVPCWQVFRDEAGRLPQRCLGCEVFRQSPVLEIS